MHQSGIYSQSQSIVSAVRLPSEEGSVPESVVSWKFMRVNVVRRLRESGIVPDN
eukprot:SAG31_NODE_13012_length_899_cov_1.656250_2_plen_54_part_00